MIVILHQPPPVATVPRAAAVGEVFADQAPLDRSPRNSFRPGVTRLFPEAPCRWLHPYLGRLAPSSFCRNGLFRFQTYQDVSGGYAQAIKENAPSNDAQFYWASVYAVRVPFRDLHYVTKSVWGKLTLIVEIDGAHC